MRGGKMWIYLMRHGQTAWNIEGKIQGRTDIPLNEEGIRQAGLLADALLKKEAESGRKAAVTYVSPLIRARETARIVAERAGTPVREMDELKERDFGFWEGKTWEEVERGYPEEFHFWEKNPDEGAPSGGESCASCRLRCRRALEQILSQREGDAAVVAHGGILVFLINELLAERDRREIIVTNASLSIVEYSRETGKSRLLLLNDTSHLGADPGRRNNKYC